MIQILKSVQYYDDNDDLYNEFNVTFEYKDRKFVVTHMVANSGAWNKKIIGYELDDFARLYGGGAILIDFDGTDFSEDELIEAAEILMESKEDELCFYDEDKIEDREFQKFQNRRRLTPQKENDNAKYSISHSNMEQYQRVLG
jgi:hypothetical protein